MKATDPRLMPGCKAVWRPTSHNVTVVSVSDGFVCVKHRDYGQFWTPVRELTLLTMEKHR